MTDLILSTLTQGLIYALISFGVYITYVILNFPDLTVDGSFPLGAAITAVMLTRGMNPYLTLPAALAAGALAGFITGLIHVKLHVRDLLSGIITQTALFSINLQIAGSNLAVERGTDTIFTAGPTMAAFGGLNLLMRKLVVAAILTALIKLGLDLYFRTKSGLLLRAVGDNASLVTTLARNKDNMKILGLSLSNAWVALAGCIVCQEQRSFSLVVPDGQFVTIVGSNGSGKTSLLNILCGSIPAEGGNILVNEKSIVKRKDYQRYATMGRVYQNPAMGTCPNLTMLENLSLADNKARPFGLSSGINKKRIGFYRKELQSLGLGLEEKLNVKMGSLSGGQRQAVALLMAAMNPLQFLILDEHTAALDPKTAEIMMRLTDKVVREKHLTALMVTHNLLYAVEYGDRIIMMNGGRIVLDRAGEEKKNTTLENLLNLFHNLSIYSGNQEELLSQISLVQSNYR